MTPTKSYPSLPAFLVAASLCLALGCGKGGDTKKAGGPAPGPSTKNGTPPTPPNNTPPTPLKADFVLTSKELDAEYRKDRDGARAKYKNKTVGLTGEVKHVATDPDGHSYLALEGTEGKQGLISQWVMCFTKDKAPWKKAAPGQMVKLRGKWPESPLAPPMTELAECEIVEVSGPAPPTLTADQLGKKSADDLRAVWKKYGHKYLFLTGEITGIDSDDSGAASITLKTKAVKPRVFCKFLSSDKEMTKQLKAGQKIKVLGQYILGNPPGEIGLNSCILVE